MDSNRDDLCDQDDIDILNILKQKTDFDQDIKLMSQSI